MYTNREENAMRWMSGLVCLALLVPVCSFGGPVPDDPAKVTPVTVGTQAPSFTALEVDGRSFHFDPTALHRPVLIIFFRGGWCPYCNTHLKDLQTVEPKIIALGYRVLFLSTDRPE